MAAENGLTEGRYGFDLEIPADVPDGVQALLNRRVIRKYKTNPINEQTMALLLSAAQSAPTKSNLQQYSIVIIRDPEVRNAVSELVPSMPWVRNAPVIAIFLGDVRRIRRLAEIRGHTYQNNNADTFMNAAVDAALAMQCFITAADYLGLGTCPISYVRNRIDDLAEILDLPDGVFPISGLCVGYPDDAGYVSMRLPQKVVVHQDLYNDDDLETDVKDYDDRNHERFALTPTKQRHTDKYGVLEKCTWSENVARQLSLPERAGFADYLKRKGINLD
ncbi:MAG: nitroreductase family protein [Rhodospirillales bacterium]|jgi:nitroreductase/FMN reductase [NAD(P)H]|tara:strand:- start:800 stop:1627 length:828 start_codon:yes stop_codon:yes gene_type:complete